jgi:accessory gene regulator B
MEQLSKKIAADIAHSLGKNNDEQEIIAYGLLGIFQLISNIGLTLLFGWIFGVPFQALVLSFSVSLLRRFSGGAHAESLNFCTLVGLVYSIFFAKVSVYLAGSTLNLWISLSFSALIMILAWITVAARAPVDSPQKPIRSIEKKQRMRKGSFQTLTFLTFVVTLLFIVGCSNKTVLSYGFSLVFGVLWQTFSLTIPGAMLLNSLDKISRKKEVKQE